MQSSESVKKVSKLELTDASGKLSVTYYQQKYVET